MKKIIATVFFVLFTAVSLCAKIPVIGISSYNHNGLSVAGLSYVESVRIAGGIPLSLPLSLDDRQIDAMLESIDALVMTGGADINPLRWFDEEPQRELGTVDDARDEFDIKLIRAAVAKGIPVLGVCRGEQAIAVAFGGSLWQDIHAGTKSNLKHSQDAVKLDHKAHSITIVEGSLLSSLLGNSKVGVNSCHHQAVKRLPAGLKASAYAPDGIIEAIERDGRIEGYPDSGAWIMGLQFHPECFISNGDSTFLPIFKALVDEARK